VKDDARDEGKLGWKSSAGKVLLGKFCWEALMGKFCWEALMEKFCWEACWKSFEIGNT
jgi:hypothetical protein